MRVVDLLQVVVLVSVVVMVSVVGMVLGADPLGLAKAVHAVDMELATAAEVVRPPKVVEESHTRGQREGKVRIVVPRPVEAVTARARKLAVVTAGAIRRGSTADTIAIEAVAGVVAKAGENRHDVDTSRREFASNMNAVIETREANWFLAFF